MARVCKNRGCNWPVRANDDICDDCAVNGTPAQQRADTRHREAHTAPLDAEIARLREWGREISKAFMRLSGGGSEMTLRIGDDFFADPKACEARVSEKMDTLHRRLTAALTKGQSDEGN